MGTASKVSLLECAERYGGEGEERTIRN